MTSSFRLGDRDPAVPHIRAALDGVADGDPELFDLSLDRAVRAFQQRRGLIVNGEVGVQTWEALLAAGRRLGSRLLSYSASAPFTGDDVVDLQERLLHLGFDCGRIDGVFGLHTDRALRVFQAERGLASDGVCGPLTLRDLDNLGAHVRGGNPHELREDVRVRRLGPSLAGKLVVVDAGHGGEDTGFVAHGICERDVVADLADRLEGRLLAGGVSVLRTHGPHDSPSEARRAAVANEAHGDVVVSLHLDGGAASSLHGVATYFFGQDRDRGSVVGSRLADLAQREIVARTDLLDCRTHAKTWELLKLTRMPAIRVETGYVSNPDDAGRLADPGFRDALAEGIHAAIQRLFLPAELDPPTGQIWLTAGV